MCAHAWILGIVAACAVLALGQVLRVDRGALQRAWMKHPLELEGGFAAAANVQFSATVVVWVIAAAIAVHRVAKRRQIQTRGAIVGCLLGAAAFGFTRDMAHDARHVLPIITDEAVGHWGHELPALAKCDLNPPPALVLHVFEGQMFVSGTAIGVLGDESVRAATASHFRGRLEQLLDLHTYAGPLDPTPKLTVAIQASPHTLVRDLMPFIEGIKDAGARSLQIESLRTIAIDSRTRGHFERHPRCVHTVPLAEVGLDPRDFETWGQLVALVDAYDARLQVR